MPIYEYECTACGAVTDIRHGFKETTSEVCPACGSALKRLFRPAGIVFKGSGFYVTDSRKAAEAKSGETKTGDAKTGDAKLGDAKPAGAQGGDAKSPAPAPSDSGPKSDAPAKSGSGGTGDAAA